MRPLWLFLVKHYFFFLFLILEGLAITMYISNTYYQKAVMIRATNNIAGKMFHFRSGISQYFSLSAVNEQLAQENADLRNRMPESFIATDNKVFVKNDTLYRQEYQYLIAKVIDNTTNRSANYLTIDKGRKHGIHKDMAVTGPGGVVGIVTEVSDNFSSVMSVLHAKSKISAKLKAGNYVGTIVWTGGNATVAKLKDIPVHVKMKIGDTVMTSGYSMIFPEGIPVGTVKYYKSYKDNDFYDIDVKLSTDFNNIRFVYVINNLLKDELEELQKTTQQE